MHDRVTLDMDPHSRAIARSHVLTIHGDADATIPVEDAFSFHSRIKAGTDGKATANPIPKP